MSRINEEFHHKCRILPFRADSAGRNKPQTTTIVALVAATIFHDDNISAEEKLLEIIDKHPDADVLNSEEAFAELGIQPSLDADEGKDAPKPANDNSAPSPAQR